MFDGYVLGATVENYLPALRSLPPGNSGVPFARAEDYIGIDEFVDSTHRQISLSRHFYRTTTAASASSRHRSGMCGQLSWT